MKIMIAQTEKGQKKLLGELREKLSESCPEAVVEIVWDDARRQASYEDIRRADPDLFINFDLAGFEQTTLTGGVVYNLLNAKQIQILLGHNLENEKYLEKQLSISMFFYCADHDYYEYLLKTYPDIPYLKEISQNAGMADVMCRIVMEIAQMCNLKHATSGGIVE